jgi:DNA-binding response OmpR family regulator
MQHLILIVEDEEDLLELLEYTLEKEGFDVIGMNHPKHLEDILEEESVHLILMDRNLPTVEGSELINNLRKKRKTPPVIYVSAKDAQQDIIEGFERGGDDYITKPFHMPELIARIHAVLKRTYPTVQNHSLTFRDMTLNLDNFSLTIDGQSIELTKLEFKLLAILIENKDRVLERSYLLDNVWDDHEFHQDKTVNVAINRLKEKIDPSKEKNYIKAVRGVGYTLNV